MLTLCLILNLYRENDKQREQHLYGIHYDDNYDYLQHLRSVDFSSSRLELISNHVSEIVKLTNMAIIYP